MGLDAKLLKLVLCPFGLAIVLASQMRAGGVVSTPLRAFAASGVPNKISCSSWKVIALVWSGTGLGLWE